MCAQICAVCALVPFSSFVPFVLFLCTINVCRPFVPFVPFVPAHFEFVPFYAICIVCVQICAFCAICAGTFWNVLAHVGARTNIGARSISTRRVAGCSCNLFVPFLISLRQLVPNVYVVLRYFSYMAMFAFTVWKLTNYLAQLQYICRKKQHGKWGSYESSRAKKLKTAWVEAKKEKVWCPKGVSHQLADRNFLSDHKNKESRTRAWCTKEQTSAQLLLRLLDIAVFLLIFKIVIIPKNIWKLLQKLVMKFHMWTKFYLKKYFNSYEPT